MLFGLAAFIRTLRGSWFAPGAFFTLFWATQVLLSFVVSRYVVWSGTILWILISALTFCLGSVGGGLIGGLKWARGRRRLVITGIPFRRPTAILAVSFLVGMSYVVIVQLFGYTLSMEERPTVALQLLLPAHFAGPLLGGMIFSSGVYPGRRMWLTFLPLIPPASLAVLFTGRTAIVAPILFWLAGYCSFRVMVMRGNVPLFTVRRILGGVCLLILFLSIALGLDVFRSVRNQWVMSVGEKATVYRQALSWEALGAVWYKTRPAVFGQVYSFSHYFVDVWKNQPDAHWGSIIFAGPLDFLGIGRGRYPFESFRIDVGRDWNVYSMLRNPIDDFGLWGSLTWWLAIGMVQGWAYERVRHGSLLVCPLLSWFYVDVALLGGYFFRYNTIILTYLMVGLYLFWITRGRGGQDVSSYRPRFVVSAEKRSVVLSESAGLIQPS